MHVQHINLRSATDAEYAALNVLLDWQDLELEPEDPTPAHHHRVTRWKNRPPYMDNWSWLLWNRQGTGLLGRAFAWLMRTEENQHLLDFGVYILPQWRGQGLTHLLLPCVLEQAWLEKRSLLLADTSSLLSAGKGFMQHIGAEPGLEAHHNRLQMDALDRGLLQNWIAQAPLADFELGLWDGPFPEDELQAICRLIEVMNTEPRESLQIEDFKVTPQRQRQMEASFAARGMKRWVMYARERSTGRFAGYTEVYHSPVKPFALEQGGTGVFPEFRGRGLGRWLKAALLLHVCAHLPEVKRIETRNAVSNAPMLKINHELGFKRHAGFTAWQLETEKLAEYLRVGRVL